MESTLFSSLSLRQLQLGNRIVVSPMCQYAAQDGCASDWHLMHLGGFAVSGAGLVIAEATAVEPDGRISPSCLGLYSDECEAALARVVAFFREHGGDTRFGIQLSHAGRKSSVLPSFVDRKAVSPEDGGWTPLSPSAYADETHPQPRVMSLEDIARVRGHWRAAVERSERLGIDLIELHFGHGYLANQFLSGIINRRTDRYGGSLENRMRLALEIFEDCRAAWPDSKPMGVRLSAIDWIEGGWTLDDSIALAEQLKQRGCDYICASSGGISTAQKIVPGPGYQVGFAEAIRSATGIATMAVGQIWEPQMAEDVLASGKADLIAIGRGMLYNPRWAWHAADAFGVFLKYPPRYRTAHPMMKATTTFAESRELKQALARVRSREREHSAQA